MSRRKRVNASKRRKTDEDDVPVVVSEKEREIFEAEIDERTERWAEEYSESASPATDAVVKHLLPEMQRTFDLIKELDDSSEGA